MPRYFFDTRDGAELLRDEEGIEMQGIEAARHAAMAGLADLAKDVIPGSKAGKLAIEVRDELDRALLRAVVFFEVAVLSE